MSLVSYCSILFLGVISSFCSRTLGSAAKYEISPGFLCRHLVLWSYFLELPPLYLISLGRLSIHFYSILTHFKCLDSCINSVFTIIIIITIIIIFNQVSLYSSGCPETHFVEQAGLELTEIILFLPFTFWNLRCAPPQLGPSFHRFVYFLLFIVVQTIS